MRETTYEQLEQQYRAYKMFTKRLLLLLVALGLLVFGLSGCYKDEHIIYEITTREGFTVQCKHLYISDKVQKCWANGRNVFPRSETFTVTQRVDTLEEMGYHGPGMHGGY